VIMAMCAALLTHAIQGLHPLNSGFVFGPSGLVKENEAERDRPRQSGVLQMIVAPDLKPGVTKEEVWDLKLRLTLATLAVILDDGSMVKSVQDGLNVFVSTIESVRGTPMGKNNLKMHGLLFRDDDIPSFENQSKMLIISVLAPSIQFLSLNHSLPLEWKRDDANLLKLKKGVVLDEKIQDIVEELVADVCDDIAVNKIKLIMSEAEKKFLNSTERCTINGNKLLVEMERSYRISLAIIVILVLVLLTCMLVVRTLRPQWLQ